jgi:hypothetical protein
MINFKNYLTEVKLATAFEALIVCAYNGGPKKDPGVLEANRISDEQYYEHEAAAKNIAKVIKTKCKPSGKATHYGDGAGKLADWWEGRGTPKTDIYVGDVRISLKEAGGSQLMSAKKGEAVSTFKAAIAYMDQDAPEKAVKLAKRVGNAMQEVVVPKTTTIGDFTTKLRAGKNVAKKLQPMADKFLQRDKAKARLTTEIKKFFEEDPVFRNWFVFEAATGFTKFSPEGPKGKPISNWVLKFDTTGKVHELEPLISKGGKPAPYVKKMAEKVKFRVSWKTPTSKGTKTFLSLRGDILKEETLPEYIPTLDNILEEATEEYTKLFSNDVLSENVLTKIGGWFKNLYKKIMDALMTVAKRGVGAVLSFLGLEVENVQVSGLEV